MPINYKNYPKNWKSEIRPAILERANNKCEFCGVENHIAIFRGILNGIEVYQNDKADIFNAENSEYLDNDYYAPIEAPETRKAIKVVLTIAHLDHDTTNNDPENLKALCQRCHNRYDMKQRVHNRKSKPNQIDLF
jgi:hypothetical protein